MQKSILTITEETAKLPILIYRALTEKNELKKKILTSLIKEAIIHLAVKYIKISAVVMIIKFILSII